MRWSIYTRWQEWRARRRFSSMREQPADYRLERRFVTERRLLPDRRSGLDRRVGPRRLINHLVDVERRTLVDPRHIPQRRGVLSRRRWADRRVALVWTGPLA
ncbi:MAG TPA: hypothetical protein VF978_02175 [Gemmatimonadales bacterium]